MYITKFTKLQQSAKNTQMKIASHNMKLIFSYQSLHKRRVNIQCCNNFLQSAVAAVATIPITRVSMVGRWINKPAATRPDASDKFMVEATSMVATSINSEFYQWIVVDHDEDSVPTQRLRGFLSMTRVREWLQAAGCSSDWSDGVKRNHYKCSKSNGSWLGYWGNRT